MNLEIWYKNRGLTVDFQTLDGVYDDISKFLERKYTSERMLSYSNKYTKDNLVTDMENVKNELIDFLSATVRDKVVLSKMVKKITDIKLKPCDPLFLDNAVYSAEDNKICLGLSLLDRNTFIHIVSHELAHSIDPCVYTYNDLNGSNQYPFPLLVECLRSEKSAGATRDNNKGFFEENVCSGKFDQIGESFADWVATEILVKFQKKNNYDQTFLEKELSWLSDEDPKKNDADRHPENKIRINRVAFAHPEIRKSFGCEQIDDKIIGDFSFLVESQSQLS